MIMAQNNNQNNQNNSKNNNQNNSQNSSKNNNQNNSISDCLYHQAPVLFLENSVWMAFSSVPFLHPSSMQFIKWYWTYNQLVLYLLTDWLCALPWPSLANTHTALLCTYQNRADLCFHISCDTWCNFQEESPRIAQQSLSFA